MEKDRDYVAEDYCNLVLFAVARIKEYVKTEVDAAKQNKISEIILRMEAKLVTDNDDHEGRTAEDILRLQHKKYTEAMNQGIFLPFSYFIYQFHLSLVEEEFLIFALLPELDATIAELYRTLDNNEDTSCLTLGRFARMKQFSVKEEYTFLKNVLQSSFFQVVFKASRPNVSDPLSNLSFRLKPRFLDFLLGQIYEDEQIQQYMERIAPSTAQEELMIHSYYRDMAEYEVNQKENQRLVFYLYGPKGSGKRENLKRYAAEKNREILLINLYRIPSLERRREVLTQFMEELYLNGAMACVNITDLEQAEAEEVLGWLFRYMDHALLLEETELPRNIEEKGFELVPLAFSQPDEKQNHALWKVISGEYPLEPEIYYEEFSNRFNFTPGVLKKVMEEAYKVMRWNQDQRITRDNLLQCCRRNVSYHMSDKMNKINCMYEWKDLILPVEQKEKLRTACRQVASRYQVYIEWGFQRKMPYGTGISMLFYGSPGTGKTMAAQVIAKELGMEIYRVDLACIVSKFVGETEKNLREIFECAGKSRNILFFDEADVLFAKRTEVKEANDKYSNMEAAYLLQKMEDYAGICILATNYLQNIDDAFRRRLKFIVEFPFPGAQERRKMWESVYPSGVPMEETIDYNYLAETFEISPSSIKNVALYSAYMASFEGKKVGMYHMIQGLRNEFQKSGKNLSKEELGEYNMYYEQR